MRHGKKILALLLMLALLASMSVCALAEEGDGEIVVEEIIIEPEIEEETTPPDTTEPVEPVVEPADEPAGETGEEETAGKMTVKCVDTEGKTLRDEKEDYLDLSKDQVLDDKSSHPALDGYTYQKMLIGTDEILKLTVSHNESGPVITATLVQGEIEMEKALTGSETLLFVYTVAAHEHSWGEGKVTKEATCTEAGVRTYTCSCGETKTEEIPALGHDWGEPSYTWAEDNSACVAARVCKRDGSHSESESAKPIESVTKEPTCTEKGEKLLKAAFQNSVFTEQSKTLELAALGHEYAHGHCKRCGALDPNFKPKLTDSTNGHASWGTDYKVTSDASPKDFQKVLIDGAELPYSAYSVAEWDGNTVVTIKGSAIKNLAVGQHSVTVVFSTGTAQRSFSVSDRPKTGDEGVELWLGLMGLSVLGLGAVLITAKKRLGSC